MGMNKDLVGKRYDQLEVFDITADDARAYADATEAGVAAYTEGRVAPPMYGVAFQLPALGAPLFDSDLNVDMLRLVHGEQDMTFLAPLVPGDRVRSVARILSIEEKESGEVLNVGVQSVREADEKPVLESRSALFIKAPRQKRDRGEGAPSSGDPFDDAPPLFVEEQEVAADQSLRYADASGDHNPIHKDPEAAKMAGLPGIILHGLCTMAFLHNALVRHLDGNPAAVRRLSVRFSRPVLMGDRLTLDVRGPKSGPFHARVTNQDGVVVLKNAVAELA